MLTYRICAMDDDDPTGDTCDGVVCTDDRYETVSGPAPFTCHSRDRDDDPLNDVAAGGSCLEEPWPRTVLGTLNDGTADGSVQDDVDYYIVNARRGQWVSAYLMSPPTDDIVDVRLRLLAPTGDVLDGDVATAQSHPSAAWQSDRDGTVTVEVSRGEFSAPAGGYELHVDLFTSEEGAE
jgi:hypothetical protein